MRSLDAYPFEVRPLSDEEGGGFLVTYQDFDECIADGETVEEAIANGREALSAVIATLAELGIQYPPLAHERSMERLHRLYQSACIAALQPTPKRRA